MTREKAKELRAQGIRIQLMRVNNAAVWATGEPPTPEQIIPACRRFMQAVYRERAEREKMR